jgi:hypothetical protein
MGFFCFFFFCAWCTRSGNQILHVKNHNIMQAREELSFEKFHILNADGIKKQWKPNKARKGGSVLFSVP